jgi:hypothetical protein
MVKAMLPGTRRRRSMPAWLVRRQYFGPNRSYRWRTVGIFRARNQDSAIRKAAFAVKHIAILQAVKLGKDGAPCSGP